MYIFFKSLKSLQLIKFSLFHDIKSITNITFNLKVEINISSHHKIDIENSNHLTF